ncbi:hypothetical protein ACHQM5_029281 [Ranunculus cassubicifolius]
MNSLIFCSCILSVIFSHTTAAAAAGYTLTPSQNISDGQFLISEGGTFRLAFFSPSINSTKRYLGIWYNLIPVRTIVWVANRESPVYDTSGVLKVSTEGYIVITNRTESVIWSSNSPTAMENPVLEFLDSGNLVLRDVNNLDSTSYVWQSFDYPSDTFLPGMKLGWNFKTGMHRYLTSWKSSDDPSYGDFTYGTNLTAYTETEIRNGPNKYYRSGPWNGVRFSGTPDLRPNSLFEFDFAYNAEEIYFTFKLLNQSVYVRATLTQNGGEGQLQRLSWAVNSNSWFRLVSIPRDRCDDYALCGAYSNCNVINVAACECLEGFKPKSPQDWSETDWSEGCEREIPLNCSERHGFLKYTGVRFPDTSGSLIDTRMSLEECRVNCSRNCSCMAYANLDIRGGGSGCIMWFTDLVDIKQLSNDGQELYIRMAASALDSKGKSRTNVRIYIPLAIGILLLSIGILFVWKRRTPKGSSERHDLEPPLYDLSTIINATQSFSLANKLGEGGFGPVYKGKLEGQEIAVKRLSKDSIQGVEELQNEVILISELQHRNLVRLLGCCVQAEEKMLIYEYMSNGSLDSIIFDKKKSALLDWQMRFNIILGIARGLLYLHHDSRLRIIHRDLKASNILLDSEMNPKISDFGLARIFGGNQFEAKTKRVVGTYGYMSPEYAIDGLFSVKSDVFSFGVLVLEIISGKKNHGFHHSDHELNLLGHAWRLWNEGKSMELVDKSMSNSYHDEDIQHCIQIGLLCVQKGTEQRPTMSSVVLMLSSETLILPKPQLPGFYIDRDAPSVEHTSYTSSNDATITLLQAR